MELLSISQVTSIRSYSSKAREVFHLDVMLAP